jgi:hypothetical protein
MSIFIVLDLKPNLLPSERSDNVKGTFQSVRSFTCNMLRILCSDFNNESQSLMFPYFLGYFVNFSIINFCFLLDIRHFQ